MPDDRGAETHPPHTGPHNETKDHAWPLVLPAVAAWASALTLFGCSATIGLITAISTAVAAATVAWLTHASKTRTTARGPRASQQSLARRTRSPYHPDPGDGRAEPGGDDLESADGRAEPGGGDLESADGRAELGGGGPGDVHPEPGGGRLMAKGGNPLLPRLFLPTTWRNITLATLICASAASASVAFRVHVLTAGPATVLAKKNATITARIVLTDDPKRRPSTGGHFNQDSYVTPATLEMIQTPRTRQAVNVPITVFASGRAWSTLLPSQHLEVTGRLAEPTPGDLVAAILLVRGPARVLTPPSTLQTAAGTLRSGLRAATDVLPPDQRGLLPGLVVGDVSRMDPQVSADLKEAGLSHLNAVSGANLAIVAGAALALSRLFGLSLPARAVFAVMAMLAFAVVARPSPSVLRALLMGLAAATALGTGRAKDGFAALSATVLFLMLFAPELARSYGFALSVAATAGILILAPRWRDALSATEDQTDTPGTKTQAGTRPQASGHVKTAGNEHPLRPPCPNRTQAASTLDTAQAASTWNTAQAASMLNAARAGSTLDTAQAASTSNTVQAAYTPDRHAQDASSPGLTGNAASSSHVRGASSSGSAQGTARGNDSKPQPSYRLPRWVAEAVAVPAAAQVAVTPVLVLMSGQLTPIAVLANLLVAPAVAPATLLGFGAALVAPIWPDAARLLVIPAGYAVGWIIMVARWAVTMPFATVPWPGGLPGLGLLALTVVIAIPILRRRAWRMLAMTAAAGALVAVLVVRPIAGPWPPKGWLMVMCDVGQGDGLVIAAGPGRGVVVDAGPDPVIMDRCLRRIGVDDVPLLVLTHPHADHVAGLPGVLRNRRIGAVLVSPERTGAPAITRISATLAHRRIPEWTAAPGTRWRFGPSEVTVLGPDPATSELNGQGEGSAINNSSVVLHVRWRVGSILLSGDLETEAQDELLHRFPVRADILKTAHHGSNRQSPAFLSSLGARAALISVGADNDYGHPAPSTIALLRRFGAAIYRTDESGDLAVVERDATIAIVPRGP
ncbi:ComEC/Rec2 family competence protein [Nonomuraea sp. NPDC002799]